MKNIRYFLRNRIGVKSGAKVQKKVQGARFKAQANIEITIKNRPKILAVIFRSIKFTLNPEIH